MVEKDKTLLNHQQVPSLCMDKMRVREATMSPQSTTPPPPGQPKLRDQARAAIRTKHHGIRTEEAYVRGIVKFILFHNKSHPMEMGEKEISVFPSHLAVADNVLSNVEGVFQLMATLMYGAGSPLIEWFRLHIKDIDFTVSVQRYFGSSGRLFYHPTDKSLISLYFIIGSLAACGRA